MIGNKFIKRIVAGLSGITMVLSMIPNYSVFADDTRSNYECVLFSQGSDNSIRISSQSISMNGDIVTNGTFSTNSEYNGIYGNVFENQENSMIDYHSTIEDLYFYEDVNYIEYDYDSTNENENIGIPTFVEGEFSSGYNVSITDSALMTIDDISICGGTFNATNSVLYSQLGNIHIETDVFSASGLIYAPFGTVYIESGNVNINGLVIAQDIEIVGDYSVNINKNENFVRTLGDGVTTPINIVEDDDIIDTGISYYKDITSEDDIIYAGDGIYCVKNQFLLTAYEHISFSDISSLVSTYNASIVGYIELTNDYQIEFDNELDVASIKNIISEILAHPYIETASLNMIIFSDTQFNTNDSEWSTAWNEASPGGTNWGIETIKLESALSNLGVISGSTIDTSELYNVKIGIIDNCFDEGHKDLDYVEAWNNYTEIADIISTGYHGTHVSGTMAALFNNNEGITGICVKNRLYGFSYAGNSDTALTNKTIEFELKYALALLIGNNVKVINYSVGNDDIAFCASQGNANAINYWRETTSEIDKFLCKMIDKGYDFLIVTSVGNSNDDVYYENTSLPYGYLNIADYSSAAYPSIDTRITYGTAYAYSTPTNIVSDVDCKYNNQFLFSTNYKIKSRVIGIGALSQSNTICDFSCRGTRVDILAPGEQIFSCVVTGQGNGGADYDDHNFSGGPINGTSMASPHVAGTTGLAFSVNPAISASRLKSTIKTESSNYGLSYKVLNAADVVAKTLDILNSLTTSGKNISSNQFNGVAIGVVKDENGNPLPDVNITATLESSDGLFNNNPVTVGTTSEDGSFEIILPAGRYRLEFEKLLYLGTLVYYEAVPEETEYIGEITLFDESWTDSIFQTVYGQVSDAMNGNAIAGATVKFRGGWNNTRGSYESNLLGDKVATTDSTGNYSMAFQVGAYTAEISKDGYITSYVNVISSPNAIIHFSTMTPVLDDDEYRIILTWGDSPRDLDSHLIGSIEGTPYEVYYGSKTFTYNGEVIASLDHDDTTSYGPETITLTWKDNNGNCSYYVYDYTNGGNSNSMALTYSSAKVVVYKGNSLIKSYNVPIGYKGTRWNVFTISNGVLTTVNTIS